MFNEKRLKKVNLGYAKENLVIDCLAFTHDLVFLTEYV